MTKGAERGNISSMGKTELKIEIDANLLRDAQEAGLDFRRLTETALKEELRKRPDGEAKAQARARQWALENAEAIQAHREQIEKYGVFGDDLRTW